MTSNPSPVRRGETRVRRPAAAPVAAATLLVAALSLLPSLPAGAATPRVHAIVGARIVTAPGKVIPHGTIVLRDGVITAVGAKVAVPADARVWEGDSLTVYPGLIDAFVLAPEPKDGATGGGGSGGRRPAASAVTPRGAQHELAGVRPETRALDALPLDKEMLESLRGAGFAAVQLAPRRGIVRGRSAVINLGDGGAARNLLRDEASQVLSLETMREGYPGSLMGGIAVIRQAFLDARWYRDVHAAYDRSPHGQARPDENEAWEALSPVVSNRQTALFVADEMLEVLRAAAMAREAQVTAQIVGAGDEYKRVEEIAAANVPLIVPVQFPEAPDVADEGLAREVATEELRHWDQAPGNPAALAKAGVSFALTANGLKDVKTFRTQVARAMARGLAADAALAAVTTTPARLLGLADRLGTLEIGKIANLTVTRGDLFSEAGKVREVWVDGNRYEAGRDDGGLKGTWTVSWGGRPHTLMVSTEKDTSVRIVVGADTLAATAVRLDTERLRFQVRRGSDLPEDFELTNRGDRLEGTLAQGPGSHAVRGVRVVEVAAKPVDPKEPPVPTPAVMGNTEAWRASAPPQPSAVLVRGATIWTSGPKGRLENADLLVRNGRIAAVGPHLTAPGGAVVIDGRGKHVAPGILDAHSHAAILGNVNECTNSITAEVRIQDVINSESVNIYRQLAGGTTVMHLLHGSCNAIGGQCAVIKNRWGESPDHLFFAAAPPTIKFALGENPKQANWGAEATGRYPQTRGGVEQVIRDAFVRARDYRAAWAEWKAHRRPQPPRRDLQLDALVEILDGRRMIHSHSYRQDEILMLMRLAQEFGFKVQTFQHVLEGYKVADEMAAHGASASSFSDWWAYKFEVIDAIPYNGYLMWDRGVNVSFNSDSDELARRLNTEAAKAVKYGGVPPEEALKFVTLNPAKQLKIDDRVGSLEPGKDADFSIWDGSPLSPYAHCEQTWIEGRKYFDRAADLAGRAALAKEREALLAKARGKKDAAPAVARNWPPRYLEATDLSGNECGHADDHERVFTSESMRKAIQNGEVQK